ncbi:MAG: hypothetical protein DRO15_04835 [Thermoprotei archaeon]|nr:MAG: hypothetical protein DRO15_04835 [Thermoprotei archaeon]
MELIKVKIRFTSYLKSELGIKELVLQLPLESTLNDLVKELRKIIPAFKYNVKNPEYLVLLDRGSSKEIIRSNIKLSEGDIIEFIPPAVGG